MISLAQAIDINSIVGSSTGFALAIILRGIWDWKVVFPAQAANEQQQRADMREMTVAMNNLTNAISQLVTQSRLELDAKFAQVLQAVENHNHAKKNPDS